MTRVARRATCLAAVLLFVFAIVWRAPAASDFWATPASDYFDVNSRWADGNRPTAADSATFDEAGTYQVQFDEATFSIYGGEPTISDLTLTDGTVTFVTTAGPTRTLSMNGTGGLHDITVANGTMNVGSVDGALNMESDGILWVQSNGTLNVRNGSRIDAGLLALVRTGGTLSVNGGADVAVAGGVNLGPTAPARLRSIKPVRPSLPTDSRCGAAEAGPQPPPLAMPPPARSPTACCWSRTPAQAARPRSTCFPTPT